MFKGLLFFIRFSWKHKKEYLILNIVQQLIAGIIPLVIIAMPKYIIEELMMKQRISYLFGYVVVLLIAVFFNNWVTHKLGLLIFNKRCYLAAAFGEYMHQKLARTDFRYLESAEFWDIKEKANKFLYGDWHGFCFVLESAMAIVGKTITAIGIIMIISTMNPWLMLLYLAMVIVSAVIDYHSKERAHSYSLDAVEIERRWHYFTRILEDPAYAKEIRLNQISQWLIDAEKEHAHNAIKFYEKRNRYLGKAGFWNAFFFMMQSALAYAYTIVQVLRGLISIGNFTMYIAAVTSFSTTVKSILTDVLDIKVYSVYYEALKKYLNIKEDMRQNRRLDLPKSNSFEIEFRNVSFRYPGQSEFAIKNISFVIKAGQKLAIVGENGSGKTTFIKLLCRLYDPTEGMILYNGIDIKELDYDQYIKLFAAVFQDFKLFSFSIQDNILWDNKNDDTRRMAFLALKQLGLNEKIKNLAKGMDTMVYKEFDSEGFEPSGGEAQKIAIARAMVKASNIVILDEPLSALDPKAEYEIFMQFDTLIENKTAVYISHRLSTCRFCDEIAVFHKGELVEHGTHSELIKQCGKYNELYNMQAHYYREDTAVLRKNTVE